MRRSSQTNYEQTALRGFRWVATMSIVVTLAAAAQFGSLHHPWYSAEYEGGIVAGSPVAATQVAIPSSALSSLATQSPIRARLNQVTDSQAAEPTETTPRFVLVAAAIALLAAAGLILRLIPLVGVALVAEVLAINYASGVKTALEAGATRYSSGWTLTTAAGQTMFWAAVAVATAATAVGGAYLFVAHRADRLARMERGEEVEETLLERIERLLTRSPLRSRS